MSGNAAKAAITVKDVSALKLIKEFSSILKKEGKINVPSYCDIVKSGYGRQIAPTNKDWFYIRCGLFSLIFIFFRNFVVFCSFCVFVDFVDFVKNYEN